MCHSPDGLEITENTSEKVASWLRPEVWVAICPLKDRGWAGRASSRGLHLVGRQLAGWKSWQNPVWGAWRVRRPVDWLVLVKLNSAELWVLLRWGPQSPGEVQGRVHLPLTDKLAENCARKPMLQLGVVLSFVCFQWTWILSDIHGVYRIFNISIEL